MMLLFVFENQFLVVGSLIIYSIISEAMDYYFLLIFTVHYLILIFECKIIPHQRKFNLAKAMYLEGKPKNKVSHQFVDFGKLVTSQMSQIRGSILFRIGNEKAQLRKRGRDR